MKCPKCIDLELVEHSQEPGIYYCGNCGGHWLEYTPMESYVVEQGEMTANAFRTIWDLISMDSSISSNRTSVSLSKILCAKFLILDKVVHLFLQMDC